MDPREASMDRLLRRSLTSQAPRLSQDFHQVLSRRIRRKSSPQGHFTQGLLIGYGAISTVTCVVVMREQGLAWVAIAMLTLGPLLLLGRGLRPRRSR
jgi:hypothetical protein